MQLASFNENVITKSKSETYCLCDYIRIDISPRDEYVFTQRGSTRDVQHFIEPNSLYSQLSLRVRITADLEDDDSEFADLSHVWESWQSNNPRNGTIAFRIFDGSHLASAKLSIAASPAQYFNLCNIAGSQNIGTQALVMLHDFMSANPDFEKIFDTETACIQRVDSTINHVMSSKKEVELIFPKFEKLSVGQIRYSNTNQNTHYFNATSELSRLAVYKKAELFEKTRRLLEKQHHLNKSDENIQRKFDLYNNAEVRDIASRSLRFEARVFGRWLCEQKFDIGETHDRGASFLESTTNLSKLRLNLKDFAAFEEKFLEHNGHTLCFEIWKRKYESLIKLFETNGIAIMNINNREEISEKIRLTHRRFRKCAKEAKEKMTTEEFSKFISKSKDHVIYSYAKARNVQKTYDSIFLHGWSEFVKLSRVRNADGGYSLPKSYYNEIAALVECGISKAALQEIKPALDRSNDKIVPLVHVISLDIFSNLKTGPDSMQIFEPMASDYQKTGTDDCDFLRPHILFEKNGVHEHAPSDSVVNFDSLGRSHADLKTAGHVDVISLDYRKQNNSAKYSHADYTAQS